MRIINVKLAFIALIPAFLLVFQAVSRHRAPSDLRDAVAEGGAAGQLGLSEEAEVPMPEAAAAEEAATGADDPSYFFKEFAEPPAGEKGAASGQAVPGDRGFSRLAVEHGLADKPAYEVLQGLFLKGSQPTEQDMIGWRTGRTLLAADPDRFMGSLLWAEKTAADAGGGPLFAGRSEIRVVSILNRTRNPAYFDVMDQAAAAEVRQQLLRARKFILTIPPASATITELDRASKLEFRKLGGYIFERWSVMGTDGKWRTSSYAYFFAAPQGR